MSYEPTNWKSGDVVTSAKLNKLENGVAAAGGGMLVVHDTDGTLDKTWQEIHDAIASGIIPITVYVDGNDAFIAILSMALPYNDVYGLWNISGILADPPLYSAASASGYPSRE